VHQHDRRLLFLQNLVPQFEHALGVDDGHEPRHQRGAVGGAVKLQCLVKAAGHGRKLVAAGLQRVRPAVHERDRPQGQEDRDEQRPIGKPADEPGHDWLLRLRVAPATERLAEQQPPDHPRRVPQVGPRLAQLGPNAAVRADRPRHAGGDAGIVLAEHQHRIHHRALHG
jgi:hypothetical protein